jgi:hypothetical protein
VAVNNGGETLFWKIFAVDTAPVPSEIYGGTLAAPP